MRLERNIVIAIDAMGGDFAPKEQVKGTVEALKNDKELFAVLCGDEEILKKELSAYTYDSSRVEIVHAPEVITNDDVPTKAVKTKKNSSTVVAFELLKEGRADALVSSGALRPRCSFWGALREFPVPRSVPVFPI